MHDNAVSACINVPVAYILAVDINYYLLAEPSASVIQCNLYFYSEPLYQ